MEVPIDIKSFQSNNISVDEMVEVEFIEVEEEEDLTATASKYFGTSVEAANFSLFISKSKDDISSDEKDKPEEGSDNRIPSKSQHASRTKKVRSGSTKLDYNRHKANVQRIRRQNLVEGIANLREATGATVKEFKTCNTLINHVVQSIPQAERRIVRQRYRLSCLAHENFALEKKIRALELEKASARNTCKQEECPKASSSPQSF